MLTVTKTFLPPIDEYQAILKRAWDRGWITNRGVLVEELEALLKDHLEVAHMILTTNGTLPIQMAIKTLPHGGEIITTPFSYVATTSSIVWEGSVPVFVDVHPEYLTIDESKIEGAITEKTTAILATHVYGNPCDVEAIDAFAKKHNLTVIYDAAHSFGVRYKNKSMFAYGDMNTCSFHATKLFHTGEGGAITANDPDLHHQLYYHHNFGHDGHLKFHGLGINAKMSELQAAMGLAIFPYLPELILGRKRAVEQYSEVLKGVQLLKIREETDWNYSYFPVIFSSESLLLKVEARLKAGNVLPRRYFYPSLDTLPYIKDQHRAISRDLSKRILCLPLFHNITEQEVMDVATIINQFTAK